MKLVDILSELLDPNTGEKYDLQGPRASSFTFSDGSKETSYMWTFKNAKGRKMDIDINYEVDHEGENPKMIISFGTSTSFDIRSKYNTMTGAGDIKAILKTIIDAAEQVIEKELPGQGKSGLLAVGFEPADQRRKRIYDYFIQNNFGQFKPVEDKEELEKLGLNKQYNWYVNRSYKA